MPLSNPTTPERDLLAVTYDKVKEIRVVDTDDQSKVLAIENLAIAGTKVTVAVDGLSGTVDGAFEDVLIQIAGKADTTQVEALDAEKVDKTSIVQTTGTSETGVMSQKAVTNAISDFVELCPFVKEFYINELGLSVDIAHLHLIYYTAGNIRIRFSNTAGNALTADTLVYSTIASASGILPIVNNPTSPSEIYGYILIDWALAQTLYPNSAVVQLIKDNTYKLDYSPTIKTFLLKSDVEENTSNTLFIKDTIGEIEQDLTLTHSTVDNTSAIWFQYPKNRVSSINKIAYTSHAGTINFYKVTYIEGATTLLYDLIISVVNTVGEEGTIKEVDVDIELSDNQFIGVNGAICYATSTSLYTRYYTISSGVISGKSGQSLFFNAYNTDSINYKIKELTESSEYLDTRITEIEPFLSIERIGEVILYNENLTSENADIVGTQTFDAFGLIVDARKVINKYYSLSDRTVKYVCKFSSNTIAEFFTTDTPTAESTQNGTKLIIDIANKRYSLPVVGWISCNILNENDVFIVSITKHYQDIIIDIKDIYSGESIVASYKNSGTGGSGAGAIGTAIAIGMQYDYYSVNLQSGSPFSISQIIINCAKCDLLIYGDSISEPEAYWPSSLFSTSWTQLIVKKMNRRAMTSGRSGTTINRITSRIANELPFIKPKYVMVTIGTNGGVDTSRLNTLVDYIVSQGSICILNHIPSNINSGGISNHAEVNAVIDQVRILKNIKGADLDIVTSLLHDGVDVDTSTMWQEGGGIYHHPNVKGSYNIYAKLQIDVPEIFE